MVDMNDEDILFRFIDGECSPSEELEILRAEREDAIIARRIRELREENARLRSAMDAELLGDLRDDIMQTVKANREMHSRTPWQSGSNPQTAMLIAACLVAAIGLGTAWSHWRINSWQDAMAAVASEREATVAQAVQQGLENYLSGDTFELSDSNSGFIATVRPDDTYKSISGHWCRSFTERVKFGVKEIERTAIACRDRDTKNWRRMQTVINGTIEESLFLGFEEI